MRRLWHHARKVERVKFTRRFAAIGAAATAAVLLGASSAQAQNDDGPLSLLSGSPLIQVCYPMGQVGQGNTFNGTQNINCSQNSEVTNPGGNGGNGAGGVTGVEMISSSTEIAPGAFGSVGAACPEGKIATGGGFDAFEPGDAVPGGFRPIVNQPVSRVGEADPISWHAGGYNESQGEVFLRVWVVCVDAAE
jgi:hypothetical protein